MLVGHRAVRNMKLNDRSHSKREIFRRNLYQIGK